MNIKDMKNVIILLLFIVSVNNTFYAQKISSKFDDVIGANYNVSKLPAVFDYTAGPSYDYSNNSITFTVQEVHPFSRTFYDFQSNGIAKEIWQDNNFPNKIHALFMVDTTTNPGNQDRRTRYFLSNDSGNSWTFQRDVPPSIRSGFPCITTLSDGRAVIINHSTDGGAPLRTQLYVETTFASNIFERKDPGPNLTADAPIWPVGISTSNISNSNKVIFLASNQSSDSAFRNSMVNLNGNGTFNGYIFLLNASTAGGYSISRSGNRIGIVFIKDYLNAGNTRGSVFFVESTDNGVTWNSPVTIWNANLLADSLGCFRSVDICYSGNNPKVFFLLCKRTENGILMQGLYSKMMLWSPVINGGVPVTVDSAGGMVGGNPSNQVFTSVCRGVIGVSTDGNLLFTAWCRARNDVDPLGNCYFDIWFSYSVDGGATWLEKTRLTNVSGPLRDCKFPSISPFNKVGQEYVSHLIFQQDSIPGAYVHGAQLALAKMMYAKIRVMGLVSVINKSNSAISYSLSQNYPNPFNPVTKIRFSLPSPSKGGVQAVKLVIYDMLGREVATLLNEQLKPGTYEVEWDGNNYPSGVYYYKLNAGDFTETKKMVLLR